MKTSTTKAVLAACLLALSVAGGARAEAFSGSRHLLAQIATGDASASGSGSGSDGVSLTIGAGSSSSVVDSPDYTDSQASAGTSGTIDLGSPGSGYVETESDSDVYVDAGGLGSVGIAADSYAESDTSVAATADVSAGISSSINEEGDEFGSAFAQGIADAVAGGDGYAESEVYGGGDIGVIGDESLAGAGASGYVDGFAGGYDGSVSSSQFQLNLDVGAADSAAFADATVDAESVNDGDYSVGEFGAIGETQILVNSEGDFEGAFPTTADADSGGYATSTLTADGIGYGAGLSKARGGLTSSSSGQSLTSGIEDGVAEAGSTANTAAGGGAYAVGYGDVVYSGTTLEGESGTWADAFSKNPGVAEVEFDAEGDVSASTYGYGADESLSSVSGGAGSTSTAMASGPNAMGSASGSGSGFADSEADYTDSDVEVYGSGDGFGYSFGDAAGSSGMTGGEGSSSAAGGGPGDSSAAAQAGGGSSLVSSSGLGVSGTSVDGGASGISQASGYFTETESSIEAGGTTLALGTDFDSGDGALAVTGAVTDGEIFTSGSTSSAGYGPSKSEAGTGVMSVSNVGNGVGYGNGGVMAASSTAGGLYADGYGEFTESAGGLTSDTFTEALIGTSAISSFDDWYGASQAAIGQAYGSGVAVGSADLGAGAVGIGASGVDINGGSGASVAGSANTGVSTDGEISTGQSVTSFTSMGSGSGSANTLGYGGTSAMFYGLGDASTDAGVAADSDGQAVIGINGDISSGEGYTTVMTEGFNTGFGGGAAGNAQSNTFTAAIIDEDGGSSYTEAGGSGFGSGGAGTNGPSVTTVDVDSSNAAEGSAGVQDDYGTEAAVFSQEDSAAINVEGEGISSYVGADTGSSGSGFAEVVGGGEDFAQTGSSGSSVLELDVSPGTAFAFDYEVDTDTVGEAFTEGYAGGLLIDDGKLYSAVSDDLGLSFGTAVSSSESDTDERFGTAYTGTQDVAITLGAAFAPAIGVSNGKANGAVGAGNAVGVSVAETNFYMTPYGTYEDTSGLTEVMSASGVLEVGSGMATAYSDVGANADAVNYVDGSGFGGYSDASAGSSVGVGATVGPASTGVLTTSYGVAGSDADVIPGGPANANGGSNSGSYVMVFP